MNRTDIKTEAAILRALPTGTTISVDGITWTKTDNHHRWAGHSVKGGHTTYEGLWNCAAMAVIVINNPGVVIA